MGVLPPPFEWHNDKLWVAGRGLATRALFAQTLNTDIVIHSWCTSVFGAILNNFYLVGKKKETSFDIFFHRIQWFLHAWTFCTITCIRLMGRNGTRPSNEPCKTCAKHAWALTPCACTGWYGQRWPKVIPTGDTANFLGWAVVSEPVEPTLAKGLAKSVSTIILVLYSS